MKFISAQIIMFIGIILIFFLSLSIGKVDISFVQLFQSLSGNQKDETIHNLIINYRLPRTITALLIGIALPLGGLLLQELFRNPLAEPFVLGISSASSLGVAIIIFLAALLGLDLWLNNPWLVIISALIGAFLALLIIVFFASKVNSTAALIIIGFMISGFAGALIGIMQFFSPSEKIKSYLVWSFGSVNGLSWLQIGIFSVLVFVGLILSLMSLKGLSGLRLGENYAHSLGINIKSTRILTLLGVAVLSASATAFTGPIAFVGLAVPHICRSFLKSSKITHLFLSVILAGIIIMLIFTLIAELFPFGSLPINIITSLFGTPIVISIVLNRQKYFWK